MFRELLIELSRTGHLLSVARHDFDAATYDELLNDYTLTAQEAEIIRRLYIQVMDHCADGERLHTVAPAAPATAML